MQVRNKHSLRKLFKYPRVKFLTQVGLVFRLVITDQTTTEAMPSELFILLELEIRIRLRRTPTHSKCYIISLVCVTIHIVKREVTLQACVL